MKHMRLIFIAIILLTLGCGGLQEVTVLHELPPNTGNVDVRVSPAMSQGKFLFEVKFNSGRTGGLPGQELMNEMISEGKRRGANVLIFECGSPGTVSQSRCNMRGYFERLK